MRFNNENNDTESGVLYLVNSRSNGKRFVRRPNPPPTSPPLDEDFDAVTQDCTTVQGFGAHEDEDDVDVDDDELEVEDVGELTGRLNGGSSGSHLNGENGNGVDVGTIDDDGDGTTWFRGSHGGDGGGGRGGGDIEEETNGGDGGGGGDPDDIRAHRSTWAPTNPVDDDFDAWTYQTPTVYTGVPVEVGVSTNSIGRIIEVNRYEDDGSWRDGSVRSVRKDKGKGRERSVENGYGRGDDGDYRYGAVGSSSTATARTRTRPPPHDNRHVNGNGHVNGSNNGHVNGQGGRSDWFSGYETQNNTSPSPTTLTLTRTTSNRNHYSRDDRRGTYRNGNGESGLGNGYHNHNHKREDPRHHHHLYGNGNGNGTGNGHPGSSASSTTYRKTRQPHHHHHRQSVDYYADVDVDMDQRQRQRKGGDPSFQEPRLALVRTPTNDSRRNGHHHHHHHHHSDEFGRLTSKSSSSRHPAAVDVNASRPAVHRRGRLPAVQNYEVVNNHVVEDGPERTVTISTWREQVANEARRSEVEMSIYYVNADEYAVEGLDEAALASYNRLTGRKETGTTANNDSKRKDRKKDRLTAARVEELRKLGMTDALEGDRRVGRAGFEPNVPGLSRGHNGIVDRAQTPWPSFSETGEYEGEDDFSNLHHVRGRGVDVGIRKKSSSALMKIPKHQNGNGSGSRNGDFRPDMSPERTSTPIHISRSPPRSAWIPGRPSRERALSPLYRSGSPPNANGSVRNGNGNGNGALGPTNSSEDSDRVEIPLALTQVLGTCEPPLLHISRALVELGITTEDHLRAVGKLKNSTRDREVKEEALKRGITIMEWAILLDRLQSL